MTKDILYLMKGKAIDKTSFLSLALNTNKYIERKIIKPSTKIEIIYPVR